MYKLKLCWIIDKISRQIVSKDIEDRKHFKKINLTYIIEQSPNNIRTQLLFSFYYYFLMLGRNLVIYLSIFTAFFFLNFIYIFIYGCVGFTASF